MLAAGLDVAQVVEGVLGGLAVAAVVTVLAVQVSRWWRQRRRHDGEPRPPALAVFVDTENTDQVSFGGGAWSARVRQRRDTVSYGYLAVAEEYYSDDTGAHWCTLTIGLPGRVPLLVVDNRAATGRSGVPMETAHRETLDDPPFDATYAVGAGEAEQIARVLSPAARDVLLRAPVQRLLLHESQLLLRTFDGVSLDDQTIAALDGLAARFLAATPSFVGTTRAPASSNGVPAQSDEPLRPGLYGPDAE